MAGPMTGRTDVLSSYAQYEQITDDDYLHTPAIGGDLDGDGAAGDLLVSIQLNRHIYLLPSPLCGTYELDRHTLLTQSYTADDLVGETIVPLPDVDGDGYDDVLISAPSDDEGAPDGGAVYTLFGGSW
jgi:hypothetical protein